MCALCYTEMNLFSCIRISKITNNLTVLPDRHIWQYEHLLLYDCYYVFYRTCMRMYHCLMQPYGSQ